MKNIHKGLVLCGMLSVLFGVGCGGAADDMSGDPSTQQDPASQPSAQEPAQANAPGEVHALCDSGYYTCPSDGTIFEYDTPGCGVIYKPNAHTRCEAYCPVTCKDSGWLGY
jgi:hypothetical protein